MDQETIYAVISEGNPSKFVKLIHTNKDFINADPLTTTAVKVGIDVIIKNAETVDSASKGYISNLESLHLLHVGSFYKMESDVHKRLINSIIRLSRKHPGDSRATLYAKQFPEYSESVAFLNHDHVVTKELDHSLSDYIQIKVNDVLDIDARTSLFKSNEEMKMFLAFKRIFSSFHIYPNVGLNNIINFSLVEDKLSDAEKNFFFKASVDLVVFEPFNNYEPIYFFELDSVWHDSSSARNKDQMKDNIFRISGLKLVRIRDKGNAKISEMEFEDLLTEIRSHI